MLHPSLNSVPDILTKDFLILSASDPLMISKQTKSSSSCKPVFLCLFLAKNFCSVKVFHNDIKTLSFLNSREFQVCNMVFDASSLICTIFYHIWPLYCKILFSVIFLSTIMRNAVNIYCLLLLKKCILLNDIGYWYCIFQLWQFSFDQ